jgi:hypothetical protein
MRLWATVCLSAAFLSTQASAQVRPKDLLTEDKIDYFCSSETPRRVDKFRFAQAIVYALRVPFHVMLLSDPDGKPIKFDERGHIMHYASSDAPFGANVSPDRKKDVDQATEARLEFMMRFDQYLRNGGYGSYRVVNTSGAPLQVPGDYFKPGVGVEIECRPKQDTPGKGGTTGDSGASAVNKALENVVIRKSVAELTTPKDKIKKVDGARFSYTADRLQDRETFAIDGLIGYVVAGSSADRADKARAAADNAKKKAPEELLATPFYAFNVTPYVYHKKSTSSPRQKDKEIDIVQPGATANLTWVSPTGAFAFDLQGEVNEVFDQAQNSEQTIGGFRLAPSFLIDDLILFKAPIHFGFMKVRPDLAMVARWHLIHEIGTNKELKGKDSFAAFGGDSGVKVSFASENTLLAALELKSGYKYLVTSGKIDDIIYRYAGLAYAFPGMENVTFDLDFMDGSDERTLQREKKWIAALAIRY